MTTRGPKTRPDGAASPPHGMVEDIPPEVMEDETAHHQAVLEKDSPELAKRLAALREKLDKRPRKKK